MNTTTLKMLSEVDCLGDNAELDHVLEAFTSRSTDCVLRCSTEPAIASVGKLEQMPYFEGFEFEDLVSMAPDLVRDETLELRFHSRVRSSEIDGEPSFDGDE